MVLVRTTLVRFERYKVFKEEGTVNGSVVSFHSWFPVYRSRSDPQRWKWTVDVHVCHGREQTVVVGSRRGSTCLSSYVSFCVCRIAKDTYPDEGSVYFLNLGGFSKSSYRWKFIQTIKIGKTVKP